MPVLRCCDGEDQLAAALLQGEIEERAALRLGGDDLLQPLARLGVTRERRKGRVGIWVAGRDGQEDKIAAIGVRLKQWVSYHGVSLNVGPDLSHYSGIVPCGIAEQDLSVTSLKALGIGASLADTDDALKTAFVEIFGPVIEASEKETA